MSSPTHPPAVAQHLEALRQLGRLLDQEPRQMGINGKPIDPPLGFLCRAIAEHAEADLAAEEAAHRTTADEIAVILTSGLPARSLVSELLDRFPSAKRHEVLQGAAMAVALLQADIALAELAAAGAVMAMAGIGEAT